MAIDRVIISKAPDRERLTHVTRCRHQQVAAASLSVHVTQEGLRHAKSNCSYLCVLRLCHSVDLLFHFFSPYVLRFISWLTRYRVSCLFLYICLKRVFPSWALYVAQVGDDFWMTFGRNCWGRLYQDVPGERDIDRRDEKCLKITGLKISGEKLLRRRRRGNIFVFFSSLFGRISI